MDAGFNEDEAEFRVLILAVGVEVFADCNGHFQEVSEVFWGVGGEAYKRTSVKQFMDRGTDDGKGKGREERRRGRTLSREDTEDLLRVTKRTWGMPCESRRFTPSWDGVRPFRANFVMCSATSCGDVLSHDGGARRQGRAEDAIHPEVRFDIEGLDRGCGNLR